MTGLESSLKENYAKYNDGIYSEYVKRMFRGVYIPFSFVSDSDININQVVRIIPEESLCFCTKARVPYKLVIETIDMSEIEPVSEDEQI